MKALTLWRPWSCAIVRGPKTIENRTWIPPRAMLGATIAIHGGKRWDQDAADDMRAVMFGKPAAWIDAPQRNEESPMGIVGVARYIGAVDADAAGDPVIVADMPGAHVNVDKAFWAGGRAWIFDRRRALATTIACNGAQGLWTLPDDVERQVREQLSDADNQMVSCETCPTTVHAKYIRPGGCVWCCPRLSRYGTPTNGDVS